MLDGNKVTRQDCIDAVTDICFDVLGDGKTTVCTLTLYNGFTVRGSASCVDPAEFNQALGEKYAEQGAREAVWPVLGAILAEKLWRKSKVDNNGELDSETAASFATSFAAEERPSYFDVPFVPHEWVVKAIQYAYSFGVCAAHNAEVDAEQQDTPQVADERTPVEIAADEYLLAERAYTDAAKVRQETFDARNKAARTFLTLANKRGVVRGDSMLHASPSVTWGVEVVPLTR